MDAVILDSELVPLMEAAPSFSFTAELLPSIREAGLGVPVELSDAVERTDHVVSTDPHVVVRVHRPKGVAGPLPCIYSIHGGGYILGSYDDGRRPLRPLLHDVPVRRRVGGVPACARDALPGAARRLLRRLEVDLRAPRRARHRRRAARYRAGPAPAGAWPPGSRCSRAIAPRFRSASSCSSAPWSCDRQVTSSSQLDGLPIWSRDSNEFGWRSYLGDLYGTDDIPIYAAPARATDLSGLPTALVIVGGADGFRDEDIDYALRLNQCGVQTELHVLPGAPHGVQMFAGSGIARRWDQLVTTWLELQLQK